MNLCLFFEGTGRGVAGKVTNVTRLRDICVEDARQMCRTARFVVVVVESDLENRGCGMVESESPLD